jgi:hypothetical protein
MSTNPYMDPYQQWYDDQRLQQQAAQSIYNQQQAYAARQPTSQNGTFNTNSGNDGSAAIYPWMGYSMGGTGFSTGAQAPWAGAQTTPIGVPGTYGVNAQASAQGWNPNNPTLTQPLTQQTAMGMFGATDDGRRDLVHDDYVNAALGNLESIASGQRMPFDQATKSNMMSQASSMSAAAEQAQAGQMRNAAAMGGASLNDPSYQAAQRELMARRQGTNAQAANAIEMEANQANFGAQRDASNQMGALRMQQRQNSRPQDQPAAGATRAYAGQNITAGASRPGTTGYQTQQGVFGNYPGYTGEQSGTGAPPRVGAGAPAVVRAGAKPPPGGYVGQVDENGQDQLDRDMYTYNSRENRSGSAPGLVAEGNHGGAGRFQQTDAQRKIALEIQARLQREGKPQYAGDGVARPAGTPAPATARPPVKPPAMPYMTH